MLGYSDIGGISSRAIPPSGAYQNLELEPLRTFQRIENEQDNIEVGNFDASRSSSIYGKSQKVQPKAFNLLMIIKI